MAMISQGGGGGPPRAPKPRPTPVSRGVAAITAPVSHAAATIAHTVAAPSRSIPAAPASRRSLPPRDPSSGRFVPARSSEGPRARLVKAVAAQSSPGKYRPLPESLIRNPIFQAINKIRDPVYEGVWDLTSQFKPPLPPDVAIGPQGEMLQPRPLGPDRMAEPVPQGEPGFPTRSLPLLPANPKASRGRFAKELQLEHGLRPQPAVSRRYLT